MTEYIYVQDVENIQRTPWKNTIIEKSNTYLISHCLLLIDLLRD
jgi:hypothetical protein